MAHVLFDASEATGLYGKPMARNVQIWTEDGRLLLDGPHACHGGDRAGGAVVNGGGLFGYRFLFPAMRVAGTRCTGTGRSWPTSPPTARPSCSATRRWAT